MLAPIREAVRDAADFDDLVRRLTELLGEMDVEPLARALGMALFKARGAGDGGVRE